MTSLLPRPLRQLSFVGFAPPIMRPVLCITYATWGVFAALAIVLAVLIPKMREHLVTTSVIAGIAVVAAAAFLFCLLVVIPRVKARLKQRCLDGDFEICGRCGYVLAGRGGIVQCPECGTTYDTSRLRRYWRWYSNPSMTIAMLGVFSVVPRVWFIISMALLMLAMPVLAPSRWGPMTLAAVPALLFWLVRFGENRLRQNVRQSDGRVCAQCGHLLNPDADESTCGGCGKGVDREWLSQFWQKECPDHWEKMIREVRTSEALTIDPT